MLIRPLTNGKKWWKEVWLLWVMKLSLAVIAAEA